MLHPYFDRGNPRDPNFIGFPCNYPQLSIMIVRFRAQLFEIHIREIAKETHAYLPRMRVYAGKMIRWTTRRSAPQMSLPLVRGCSPFQNTSEILNPSSFLIPTTFGQRTAERVGSYRTLYRTSCSDRLRGSAIRMRAFLKIVCTYVAAPTEANGCTPSMLLGLFVVSKELRLPSRTGRHARRRTNGTLSFAFAPLSTLHSCWRIFTLHDTFALNQDRSVRNELPLNRFTNKFITPPNPFSPTRSPFVNLTFCVRMYA